jgi:hypothetical protein
VKRPRRGPWAFSLRCGGVLVDGIHERGAQPDLLGRGDEAA